MKNKKLISTILTITMLLALTGCEQGVSTPSVLTPTSTPTAEPVATETPVPTETLEPTMAPTEAPVATETPVPTATPTEAPREESVWTETNRIESSCTVSGLVTYTDQYGETKTEELPFAAHTPGEPEVIPATVDEEGLVVVRCTVCGEIISSEVLPKLTPTNTPVPTNTPTNTPKPTATNTPKPTATNTPKPTATNTPTPTTVLKVTVYDVYYRDGSDYLTTVTRGTWDYPAGKLTTYWYALGLNDREFVSGKNGVRGVAFMDLSVSGADWKAEYANGSNQKVGGIMPNGVGNVTITYRYKVTFDYYTYVTSTPTPAGSGSGASVTQVAGGGTSSGSGTSGSGVTTTPVPTSGGTGTGSGSGSGASVTQTANVTQTAGGNTSGSNNDNSDPSYIVGGGVGGPNEAEWLATLDPDYEYKTESWTDNHGNIHTTHYYAGGYTIEETHTPSGQSVGGYVETDSDGTKKGYDENGNQTSEIDANGNGYATHEDGTTDTYTSEYVIYEMYDPELGRVVHVKYIFATGELIDLD